MSDLGRGPAQQTTAAGLHGQPWARASKKTLQTRRGRHVLLYKTHGFGEPLGLASRSGTK